MRGPFRRASRRCGGRASSRWPMQVHRLGGVTVRRMDTPTAADIRAWAPPAYDFAAVGFPAPTPPDADPLDVQVRWAVSYVVAMTGRQLLTLDLADPQFPALAEQAITWRVVQQVAGSSRSTLRATFGAPWLKSFTAGSYSETRFAPVELVSRTGVNDLPVLADLLWLLMTEEKRDEWLERLLGRVRPAATFSPGWPGMPPSAGGLL